MPTRRVQVKLGATIGRGGEAIIRSVQDDPATVAKIYLRHDVERDRKLRAMLELRPENVRSGSGHVNLAWPTGLLLAADGSGDVSGVLLPKVRGFRVAEIYNLKSRLLTSPGFTWRYMVRAAMNLSLVTAAVHAKGHVIGDVNETNAFVTQTAELSLVDTDSFQVIEPTTGTVFRCTVGTPSFTPPELQGTRFDSVVRTPAHDSFGISVLTYLLLMEGFHPFSLRYTGYGDSPTLEQAIGRQFYAGGQLPNDLEPPPFAPPLQILSEELRDLFAQAFTGRSVSRPNAQTWAASLGRFEQTLRTCTNQNHVFGAHLTHCPWCARTLLLGGRDPYPSPEAIKERRHLVRPTKVHIGTPLPTTASPVGGTRTSASAPQTPTTNPPPTAQVARGTNPASSRTVRPPADMAIRFAVVAAVLLSVLAVYGAVEPGLVIVLVMASAGAGWIAAIARDAYGHSGNAGTGKPFATSGTFNPPPRATTSAPRPPSAPATGAQLPSVGLGVVIGSRIRNKYHRPSCEWAQKISYRNRITFPDAAHARSRGYRACGSCRP